MKKILLALSIILAASFSINAQQISNHAIGIRIDGGNGTGEEISYQKLLNNNNRLEVNLGFGSEYNDFKATGLYQWIWSIEEQFNWYTGIGGGIASANKTGIYGAGLIGIEYNFRAPLIVALDYRPEIGYTGNSTGLVSNMGIAVRYQF
ncbi:hypothetical protein [Polaribacter sp. Q13]|uniref:hypothetical protein n=1 Tax=Polaribacter sp. Q13 TaxID=2806551 RepID=UPI00193C030E|nr:hypothetical protein [Polaribacter sp. Q13]QVY65342.1 hypothetical protein JOP69_16595 [Polaribacter sp. Q13]